MKKTISIFLIIIFAINIKAQYVSGKLIEMNITSQQTVSVILTSNEIVNASLKESMKLYWKKCKYEFVTYDEIADTKRIGDYYLTVISIDGLSNGYSTTAAYTAFAESNKEISDKNLFYDLKLYI